MKVDFYRHQLGTEEINSLVETLHTPFLTTGPRTIEFEKRWAERMKSKHALGVTSCTAGLFLALKAMGVGPGDEVIVPAMTFIASANVVLHCGAEPILVDVERDTGLIDLEQVKKAITPRTKVILPVHLYGHLCDMVGLKKLADQHGLKILEDAAHAVESTRDGAFTGSHGDIAAYSFYATKNVASGEGGAVTTQSQELNDKMRLIRQHGMSTSAADRYHNQYKHWDMLDLGYKYNMFDIQAALLLPQLSKIDEKWKRREEICMQYESAFNRAGIEFPIVKKGAQSARHLFTVWAPRGKRDQILKGLQEREIGVAVNYRAIHLLTYYRERYDFKPGVFPNAEEIGDRTITIPLYPSMKDTEIEAVIRAVTEAFAQA